MYLKKSKEVSAPPAPGILDVLRYKYLPYWPLFLGLMALFLLIALFYSRYQQPLYNISATVVISDQAKGAGEAETVRSLNIYAANKIVENEVQVLQSRSLMDDVVRRLHLYAPVYEKGKLKPASAYLSSPVRIEVQRPQNLKEQKELPFSFEARDSFVQMGGHRYALNQWIRMPNGTIRFVPNPDQKIFTVRPLYFSLVPPRMVSQGLLQRLEVGAGSKLSTIIHVNFKDEVPERGERIVNELLAAYGRSSIESNAQLAANTLAFVEERLGHVERELDSIERMIQQFKTNEGIVDLSEQSRVYLQSLSQNNQKIADINMQLAILDQVEKRVLQRDNRTGIIPTSLGINDPVLADLLQKLNELELQHTELRTSTGENHPLTRSVANELAKIRPSILNIVRNQRAQLGAGRTNLDRATSSFETAIRTIPGKERGLLEISRQQAIKRDIYALLLQRREEAALSNASTISQSRVVDYAQASVLPVQSKKMMILAGALVLALVLGIILVFLKENAGGKVLFRSSIEERTQVPVMGELPYAGKKAQLDIMAQPTQAVQRLVAALGLYQPGQDRKVILLTSAISGEGKSYVSRQLATQLALTGRQVLLADMNLYTASTTAFYQQQDSAGLGGYILGGKDLSGSVQATGVQGLHLLAAGNSKEKPLAILSHERLAQLIGEARGRYDHIIIDAPPVELATDAFVLSGQCDHVVFVVRYAKTPVSSLRKLEQWQHQMNRPMGLVFNAVRSRGFIKTYYGYGYGYGYESWYHKKTYQNA